MIFKVAVRKNFKIKEFNQRFFPVNFDISFYEILPVFWKQLLHFLLYFDSCPAEAIMNWIIKQMNTLFISVVPRCFGEIVWQKKSLVSQENVSGGALF